MSQPISEQNATPEPTALPSGTLKLLELQIKNSEKDWVLLQYISPTEEPANLKGIVFQDDSKFKTIKEDFIVASGQEILLTYKSEDEDIAPYLYSSRSGLTGTTEQFIIWDGDTVIDAVCWTSEEPTESEIKDMEELYEDGGWASEDPADCINSEIIEKDHAIWRTGASDTNSKQDWEIEMPPPVEEPEEKEETTEVENENDNAEDNKIEDPDVEQIEKPKEPISLDEEPTINAEISGSTKAKTESLVAPELVSIEKPIVIKETTSRSSKKDAIGPSIEMVIFPPA